VAELLWTACTCSCGRAQAQELQARALALLQGDERVRQRLGGRVSAAPGGLSTRHAPLPLARQPAGAQQTAPTSLLGGPGKFFQGHANEVTTARCRIITVDTYLCDDTPNLSTSHVLWRRGSMQSVNGRTVRELAVDFPVVGASGRFAAASLVRRQGAAAAGMETLEVVLQLPGARGARMRARHASRPGNERAALRRVYRFCAALWCASSIRMRSTCTARAGVRGARHRMCTAHEQGPGAPCGEALCHGLVKTSACARRLCQQKLRKGCTA
jgi:hypothetical protein